MINADDITAYDAEQHRLEEQLLFWVVVAGKGAHQQAQKLELLLQGLESEGTPFDRIRAVAGTGKLEIHLRSVRMGQYTRITRAFIALAFSGLDLATCSLEDLEAIPGIGPKTARCFLLHTRRNARCAGLDTHVLKWLAAHGVPNVPKVTPSSKREYARLEQEFLRLYDSYYHRSRMTVGAFDLMIWAYYAGRLDALNEAWFESKFVPYRAAA